MRSKNSIMQVAHNEKIDSLRSINSFFGLIMGTLHLENRISRLFQACFIHSLLFREAFFRTLPSTKNFTPRNLNEWDCIYQPQTPDSSILRPDLLICKNSVDLPHSDNSSIFIESKIRATLTEQQLNNYRNNGVKTLIALTKYLPKIPKEKINEISVIAIRWQDLHSSLSIISHNKHNTQHDRNICKQFLDYLEEAEMAYNQVLSVKDFKEIAITFSKIAKPSKSDLDSFGKIDYRFDCLSRCSSLLSEIAREVVIRCPKLVDSKTWTGYYKWPDDNGIIEHYLQCSLFKKSYNKTRFSWYFCFPQDSKLPVSWGMSYFKKGEEKEIKTKVKHKDDVLPEKLIMSVVKSAAKWKVSL